LNERTIKPLSFLSPNHFPSTQIRLTSAEARRGEEKERRKKRGEREREREREREGFLTRLIPKILNYPKFLIPSFKRFSCFIEELFTGSWVGNIYLTLGLT